MSMHEETCRGCGDVAPVMRHEGSPIALCDKCERHRKEYVEAMRPRSFEESMTVLLKFAWCGNATNWIREMSREDQELQLSKLSPELAAKWREVLGLGT